MSKFILYTQAAGRAAVYTVCITIGVLLLSVIVEALGGAPTPHIFYIGLGIWLGSFPMFVEKLEAEANPKVTNIHLTVPVGAFVRKPDEA